MAAYEVVLVSRSPKVAGAPDLVEVDRLAASSLSYTDELSRPGSGTVSCKVATLSAPVKERLRDLRTFPSEVWVYAGSALAWAGEVRTLSIQSQTVTLNMVGLLGYMDRMGITEDVTFSQVDQLSIAKSLVDAWQAKTRGNYGIGTTAIAGSGVLRDRTYLYRDQKTVLSAVTDLGGVIDGFDIGVEPDTRQFKCYYPHRGEDLSGALVLDSRSVASANVQQSVAPDDLVSDVGALGSAQDDLGTTYNSYAYREVVATQNVFGRSWRGQSYSDVKEQGTLEAKADAYLATRGQQLLQPGVTIRPNAGTGVTVGSMRPGDTVAYAYDAGLGMQSGNYRIAKVTVSVDDNGQESMSVDFV